jgi:hypothetical protein
MDKSDLTIVMQGYLSYESIGACNAYQNFGNVILSTWNDQNTGGFSVPVLSNPYPAAGPYNWQNLYFQVYSSHMGLKEVKTKFAIKVRADIIVADLSRILEKLETNPDKIISISHLFRDDGIKFHPSDLLLAGKTEILNNGFKLCKERCETHAQVIDGFHCSWAEQWIGTSLLKAKGIQIEQERSKAIMQANMDVVSARDLGFFHWKSTVYSSGHVCNPYLDTIIHKMEDL